MDQNLSLTSNFVITSNDLIEAKYDYSLWEKRVFVYMISTLKRDETGFKPVKIYIRDLMRFFGTHSNNDYSVIRAIPETISQKPFYVPYQTKDGGKRWSIINVLSIGTQPDVGDRSEGNAYIELKFNADLIPYLLELKEKFTKYDIRNITGLKSVYSIRLYEYLKENEWRKGLFEVTIAELKEMFYMSAKDNGGRELYPLYADFKKRVLLKAQEDLNTFCDIKFNFWEKKQGKKVVAVVFEITSNQKPQIAAAAKNEALPKEDLFSASDKKSRQELFNALFPQAQLLDISESALRHVIDTCSADLVLQGFEYTMLEFNKGKIKENIDGYFITAVKNNFTSANFEKEQKRKKTAAERKQKEAENQQLQLQLEDLRNGYDLRRNAIIRELLSIDDSLTQQAIDVIQAKLVNYFKLKNLDPSTLDIAFYRQDPVLRIYVIEQIQLLKSDAFEELIPLKAEIDRLENVLRRAK
jgi:plasmid replication initiation protein